MTAALYRLLAILLLGSNLVDGNSLKKQKIFTNDDINTVLASWRKLEVNLKYMTDTVVKSALPRLFKIAGEVNISEDCYESLNKLIFGFVKHKLWAFRFLDASAKLASGYLTGTASSLGNYDECLDIRVPDPSHGEVEFQGQYCVLDLRLVLPPKPRYFRLIDKIPDLDNVTLESELVQYLADNAFLNYIVAFRFGICVPSTCTIEDVRNVVHYGADLAGFTSDVPSCEIKKTIEPDSTQIAIVCAFVIVGVVIIILTLVEIFPNPWLCEGPAKPIRELSFSSQIINSCSLNANTVRLLNTVSPDPRTDCLNGIKFFSITWVVLGHTYLLLNWQLISDHQYNKSQIMEPLFQVVMSALVSVDTFFTVTSFLLSSITIQVVDKYGRSVFKYSLFVINRLIRLLPMMFATTGLAIILPLIGYGPMWHETVDIVAENCRKNWWYNFIFLGNFLDPTESCFPHFWYSICDMQLLPVAMIFLILVLRKPLVGLVFAVSLIGISCITTAVVTYVKDLQPTILLITSNAENTFDMWRNCHFMPFVHLAPYGVGLVVGYLFARHSNVKINPFLQGLFWIISFISAFFVTHGTSWWNAGKPWEVVETLLYAGLHRTVWCICVGWMIFACCTGRGGVINRILSWKGFTSASRLTYSVYMIHCLVIWFAVGSIRTTRGGQLEAIWMFLTNLTISFGLAFICYVFIEAPANQFFKMIVIQIFVPNKLQHCDGVSVDTNGTSVDKKINEDEKESKHFTKL